MDLFIKVIPHSSQEKIVDLGGSYKVYLRAKPIKGEANEALVAFLAEYFSVKKYQVKIIKGLKSRQKIIRIEGI